MTTSYISVTDQFCGAGGSSIGAEGAGAEQYGNAVTPPVMRMLMERVLAVLR